MPKNCIVVGCGRSGTSMVAGSIASAGYNIGGTGHFGNEGNPKGYFETKEVNNINDTMLFSDPKTILTKGSQHGWLTRFPEHMCPEELPNTRSRIEAVLAHEPFCLKDPRFSYTLPVWQKYLLDVAYICVIRHPGTVVNSIMQNCKTAPSLSNIEIDRSICYDIWTNMYNHLLCLAKPNWLFLHYDQILGEDGLDRVEDLLGTQVNRSFPTASLRRSKQTNDAPTHVINLYNLLCDRAGYKKG